MKYQVVITALPRSVPGNEAGKSNNWALVGEKPLIQRCAESFSTSSANLITVVHESERSNIDKWMEEVSYMVDPHYHGGKTAGALCTALLAVDRLNPAIPIVISAGDIHLEPGFDHLIDLAIDKNLDAAVFAHVKNDPDFSYVRANRKGQVMEVAEKRQISETASTGVYFFRDPKEFLSAGEWVLRNNISHDGTFYLSAVVNYMISRAKDIRVLALSESWEFKRYKYDEDFAIGGKNENA